MSSVEVVEDLEQDETGENIGELLKERGHEGAVGGGGGGGEVAEKDEALAAAYCRSNGDAGDGMARKHGIGRCEEGPASPPSYDSGEDGFSDLKWEDVNKPGPGYEDVDGEALPPPSMAWKPQELDVPRGRGERCWVAAEGDHVALLKIDNLCLRHSAECRRDLRRLLGKAEMKEYVKGRKKELGLDGAAEEEESVDEEEKVGDGDDDGSVEKMEDLCGSGAQLRLSSIARNLPFASPANAAPPSSITKQASVGNASSPVANGAKAAAQPVLSAVEGVSRLFQLTREGDADGVKALVKMGVPVDSRFQSEEFNSTALHIAAENGDLKMVKALLRAGANPNVSGNHDKHSFVRRACSRQLRKGGLPCEQLACITEKATVRNTSRRMLAV